MVESIVVLELIVVLRRISSRLSTLEDYRSRNWGKWVYRTILVNSVDRLRINRFRP